MKITFDIDCTPEEARAFLGLPDVRPMQDRLMQDVQNRLAANLKTMDPAEMLKLWLPSDMKGFDRMFRAFTGKGE